MSVSYVDMDGDTDNDSVAPHRPPSRLNDEDYWEYPGVKGSDVVGLIMPINDNNDTSWERRDSHTPLDPNDPETLHLKLDIRPRKAGQWNLLWNWPAEVWWDANTTVNQTDRILARNQDIQNRTSWFVAGYGMQTGTRGYLWSRFAPNEPRAGSGYIVEDDTNVLFIGCDVDVDTSNNGVIDSYNDGTSGSDFYEAHPMHSCLPVFRHGMIVGVNDDDDDGNNHPDNGWNGTAWWDNSDPDNRWANPEGDAIQGTDDSKDLRSGILRGLGVSESVRQLLDQQQLAPVLRLRKVTGSGAIRLFTECGQWNAVLIADGQWVGGTSLWNAVHQDGMNILVEGLRTGEVMLAYELYLRNGAICVHRDIVRITVAPWMATSHRDEAVRVYVTSATPAAIRARLAAACPVPVKVMTESDPWIQDQMLLGFRSWHHTGSGSSNAHWHTAIINSPRARGYGLEDGVAELLGPNTSVIRPGTPAGTTFDSFGNVDAFPPYDGSLGHVYYGTSPQTALTNFFGQQAQVSPQAAPVSLGPTDWLHVGHIDEIMSVRMNDSSDPDAGFHVILASPRMGIAILKDDLAHVLQADWLYKPSLGDMTAQQALEEDYWGDTWETLNDGWQEDINVIKGVLNTMGIDTVDVPAYFAPTPDGAVSLLPNTVNMLNVNGTLIALHPGSPRFATAMNSALGGTVVAAAITYIDGFELHRDLGGLHCATNTERVPRDNLKRWWEQQ